MNGGSQAVRLPAEFRFEGDHVFIRKDSVTGEVILSQGKTLTWQEFKALARESGPLEDDAFDFLENRDQSAVYRDPFEGWAE